MLTASTSPPTTSHSLFIRLLIAVQIIDARGCCSSSLFVIVVRRRRLSFLLIIVVHHCCSSSSCAAVVCRCRFPLSFVAIFRRSRLSIVTPMTNLSFCRQISGCKQMITRSGHGWQGKKRYYNNRSKKKKNNKNTKQWKLNKNKWKKVWRLCNN